MVTALENDSPHCPYCQRQFSPGATWIRANYCRAAYLATYVAEHPGETAWDISRAVNMLYSDVQRGLLRAREWALVAFTAEVREQGGERYRYHAADDWRNVVAGWDANGYI